MFSIGGKASKRQVLMVGTVIWYGPQRQSVDVDRCNQLVYPGGSMGEEGEFWGSPRHRDSWAGERGSGGREEGGLRHLPAGGHGVGWQGARENVDK